MNVLFLQVKRNSKLQLESEGDGSKTIDDCNYWFEKFLNIGRILMVMQMMVIMTQMRHFIIPVGSTSMIELMLKEKLWKYIGTL